MNMGFGSMTGRSGCVHQVPFHDTVGLPEASTAGALVPGFGIPAWLRARRA